MYEQTLNCHNRWSLLFAIIYCYDLTLENGSVDLSLRLRATVPFNGRSTLLLSEKPVYNCYVFSTQISIKCYQYQLPWNPGIWTTPRHWNINITWLIKPMKIKPPVNISMVDNFKQWIVFFKRCSRITATVCARLFAQPCYYDVRSWGKKKESAVYILHQIDFRNIL